MTLKYFNVKNGLTTGNITLNAGNGNIAASTFVGNINATGTANLGSVANLKISGGASNYVLSTDGAGNLSWVAQSGGSGESYNPVLDTFTGTGSQSVFTLSVTPTTINNTIVNIDGVSQLHDAYSLSGTSLTFDSAPVSGAVIEVLILATTASTSGSPGGSNTQVQFNNSGNFAGNPGLTFNSTSTTLTANNFVVSNIANLTNVNLTGNIIPTVTNTYTLGSPTFNFKDVYIGPGSLYINGQKVLEQTSNTIVVTADLNQSVRLETSGTGVIELLPTGSGVIAAKGTFQLDATKSITSSDGDRIKFSDTIAVDSLTTFSANTDLVISANGTGGVRVDDNFVVTGNLTVQGSTSNLSVANLIVQDNIIDISAETTGTPVANAGIRVVRGDEPATQIRWTESNLAWQFTNDGTNYLSIVGRDNSGNINLGNVTTANYFVGNLWGVANSAIVANTVTTNAQPNITSLGTLTNLNVSGNSVIGGNLTVNGDLVYINVTDLSVEDSIIQLQTGPNATPPSSNSGKDVGTALNYFDTGAKVAWMGWDVSNAEIALASNVSIVNEVATFNQYANVRANIFIGNGASLSSITGANVTGTVANATNAVSATTAGTVTTAAQPNITSVGLLTELSIGPNSSLIMTGTSGFIRANSIQGTDGVSALFTRFNGVTGAVGILSNLTVGTGAAGNITANGNVTASFFIGNGSALSSITGSNITGQVGNALVSGTVYTNAQPNITSIGTLSNLTSNGTINFTNASNVSLGAVGNIKITGGTSNQVLRTDGAGNLSWVTQSGGGGTANIAILNEGNILTNTVASLNFVGDGVSATANGNAITVTIAGGGGGEAGTGTFVTRTYTGDGNTTTYSVTSGVTANSILVMENGIVQVPTTDYSVSGANLQFTSAPASNMAIQVREIGGGISAQDLLSPFLLMGA